MALVVRYINGFDRENNSNGATEARFLPYVPTFGIAHSFSQGDSIAGYRGGRAWRIFNTAFWEINYSMPLYASHPGAVFHGYIMASNGGGSAGLPVYNKVLFLRFENGANNIGVSVRIKTDGHLEIMTGGVGDNDNTTGTVHYTSVATLPPDTWVEFEMRVDCGAGRVRMWLDRVLEFDGSGLATGAGVDRVTWRWQSFGQIGMAGDHFAVASDDSVGSERIDSSLITGLPPIADYAIDAGWTPNSGVSHFPKVGELTGVNPDDDGGYLAGSGASGDDLFTFQEPNCFGLNLAVALNIDRRLTSGAPEVIPRLLHPESGAAVDLGASDALTSGYRYQQFLMITDPVAGDYWTDANLFASAFGFRGAGSGASRVTFLHLEKLTSLRGLPFSCGDEGNYII